MDTAVGREVRTSRSDDSGPAADEAAMWIVFLGPPGAGKGTQSKRLTDYLQIPHMSTGEMLRASIASGSASGRLAASYMDAGRLVPDPMVLSVVGERLESKECCRGCLFDGFPRTIQQAKSLDDMLEQRGLKLGVALELRADEPELVRRMLKRAAVEKRVDDNPATIAQRMDVYRRQTAPLIQYYEQRQKLSVIDAMQAPEKVFQDIQRVVDGLKDVR